MKAPLRSRPNRARCQKVWQAILVLATLALAMAANAQATCAGVFMSAPASLEVGRRITIPFSFKLYRDATLEQREAIIQVAEREEIKLRSSIKQLEVDQPRAKNKLANTLSQARARKSLEQVEAILAAVTTRAPLGADERALLANYKFEDSLVYGKKADLERVQDRVVELERMGATVEDEIKIPPSRLSRALQFMKKRWYFTLTIASLVTGAGYQVYVSHQAQATNPAYQPQVIEQSVGGSQYVPGSARDDQKTAIPQ